MTLAYRRLNDGLPSTGGEALRRFPSDARNARAWVAALPRANAQATQMELSDALDSLAGQRLKGTQRLLVLEELRPAVLESIDLLKRQFIGGALPLPGLKARAAQQAETFQLEMAGAYRKAAAEICAPEGRIPMLRGGAVTKALQRSAWHYCKAAELAWRLYRDPAEGVWQGLHRVYRFALEHRLEIKPSEDDAPGNQATLLGLYVQALLMSVAQPLAHSQTEQDTLWQMAHGFSGQCALQSQVQHADAACVPEDSDQGPGQRLEEESDPFWLDMRAFSDGVTQALSRSRDGRAEVIPGRGLGVSVSIEALQRLQRAFGMAAARTHKRRLAGHTLQTVFGLSAMHFYLAGRRDFESFLRQNAVHESREHNRNSWAVVGPDAAKVPLFPARAIDHSLGGYRLAWDQAQNIRARVGELIGINLAEDGGDPDWMLGIVRWLRYEPGDSLAAGIELLSRRTTAIALCNARTDGRGVEKPPIRAVALLAMRAGDSISYLVAGNSPDTLTRFEVMRDPDVDDGHDQLPGHIMVNTEIALAMGDYTLYTPLPANPVAIPEPVAAPIEPIEPVVPDESPVLVDAFAEPDEPLESISELSESYELIEPNAESGEDLSDLWLPGDWQASDGDARR